MADVKTNGDGGGVQTPTFSQSTIVGNAYCDAFPHGPPETVAIIGMGPSMKDFFTETITQDRKEKFADEIWCINLSAMALRCDRVVWMDDLKSQNEDFEYSVWDLARLQVPVLTTIAYPELVPMSENYPISPVADMSLDYFGRIYINNSVAYAIAYAMLIGVKLIKLYGCDFTYPNRNTAEEGRACVEAWLTVHSQQGGHVQIAPSSCLYDMVYPGQLYGYSNEPIIQLKDGSSIQFKESEEDSIDRQLKELTIDSVEKNGKEIDRLIKLKAAKRAATEIESLENRINDLKKETLAHSLEILERKENGSNGELGQHGIGERDSPPELDDGNSDDEAQEEATPQPG